MEEFLNNFDGLKGNNDGKVTKNEFNQYYEELAMSTPNDEYFCAVIQQACGVAEDELSTVF